MSEIPWSSDKVFVNPQEVPDAETTQPRLFHGDLRCRRVFAIFAEQAGLFRSQVRYLEIHERNALTSKWSLWVFYEYSEYSVVSHCHKFALFHKIAKLSQAVTRRPYSVGGIFPSIAFPWDLFHTFAKNGKWHSFGQTSQYELCKRFCRLEQNANK